MQPATLLVVDDEPAVRHTFRRYFERRGWRVREAGTAAAAVEAATRDAPDVVLLDLRLPDGSGLAVLEDVKGLPVDVPVLMLTGHGDIPTAVQAMRAGAETFLTKPVELDEVARAVTRAVDPEAGDDGDVERTGRGARSSGPAATGAATLLETAARTSAPVLLCGETGTGKTALARRIHDRSDRRGGPFVGVSGAALSADTVELELFGSECGGGRGAGALEAAAGGTVLLDGVAELPLPVQVKLLRVLESGEVWRIGGRRGRATDVRVIATTEHDLARRVEEGTFHRALHHRLAVLTIALPPLRERSGREVAGLARSVLRSIRSRIGEGPDRISRAATRRLARHDWPGNLRELRNVLERAAILNPDAPELLVRHLPPGLGARRVLPEMDLQLASFERRHIQKVLRLYRGNRRRTAEALGIARSTLYDRMKRYGLDDGQNQDTP